MISVKGPYAPLALPPRTRCPARLGRRPQACGGRSDGSICVSSPCYTRACPSTSRARTSAGEPSGLRDHQMKALMPVLSANCVRWRWDWSIANCEGSPTQLGLDYIKFHWQGSRRILTGPLKTYKNYSNCNMNSVSSCPLSCHGEPSADTSGEILISLTKHFERFKNSVTQHLQ